MLSLEIEQFIPLITSYGYLILFPLVVVEGPAVSLIAGFLVFLGYIHFWPTLIVLLLADLTSDAFYYAIGRFGNKQRLIQKYGGSMQPLWQSHPKKMMFLGKLAYGLSVPLIVSAGVTKVPPGKFFLYALPATILQYGGILVTSYYLGRSYQLAEKYIFYIGIVLMLILILVLVRFLHYAKQQVVNELNSHESTPN